MDGKALCGALLLEHVDAPLTRSHAHTSWQSRGAALAPLLRVQARMQLRWNQAAERLFRCVHVILAAEARAHPVHHLKQDTMLEIRSRECGFQGPVLILVIVASC